MATLPDPETVQTLPARPSPRVAKHVLDEVDAAISGGFRPNQAAAVREPLAGEDAGVAIRDPPVLAEQVSDFSPTHADVSGWHVHVLTDVAIELGHHRFTEAHHFAIRLPFRIEIGSALRAAHRQAGQAVLEDLLEPEELQDRKRDRGMETQAAFVGPDGVVELHTVGAVDLDVAAVVDPGDAKHDHAVGLGQPLENLRLAVLGAVEDERHQRLAYFADGLVELRLSGRALGEPLHEEIDRARGLAFDSWLVHWTS